MSSVPLPQSSPVLVVSDRLANLAIQSHDSFPVSQDPPQNCSDSRSFIMYSRSQLLFLVKSPLVRLPCGMPPLRDWFGTENDQSGSKKDSETPLPVGNSQDRQFYRDTDDGGSARQNFMHQSICAADRDRDRDAEKEQDWEWVNEDQEQLCDLSDEYDFDRRVLSSILQMPAMDRELAPKPRLAFLGPLGTYSHQAAFEYFCDSVEYLARPTIADVQQTLSAAVPFGVIPHENSINGSVVETYNILRIPVVGQDIFVRGVTVFQVKHSLVIRRGVKMEDIENVLSHEQALGQCREWLAKHLPQASSVPTDSTASAAKRLLSVGNGLDPMKCAAICSSVVVTIYEGLEVLEENIQDRAENFTRFYILSHGRDVALPKECSLLTDSMALLRFQAPPGSPVKPMLNIPSTISALDILILRIDRRPSLHSRPFDNVYFLEVGAIPGQNNPEQSWAEQLEQAVDKVRHMGVEVLVLGCW